MKRLTLLFFATLVALSTYAQNCPPSHPYEACGRCWESASQAQSGGCDETTDPTDPPSAPSNLVSTSVTQTSVGIQWNDNSSDEEGFEIYRNNTLVATVGAGVTSYNSQNLASNTTYTFEVLAYNGNLKSAKTSPLQITTEEDIPSDELGNVVLSSRNEGNGWVIEWNSVNNATSYTLNIVTKEGNTELSNDDVAVTGLSFV